MVTYAHWDRGTVPGFPDGLRVVWYYDELYNGADMWALETPEATAAAVEYEAKKLESGEWVALGYVLESSCPTCGAWQHDDSLWGIVIPQSDNEMRNMFLCHCDLKGPDREKIERALRRL